MATQAPLRALTKETLELYRGWREEAATVADAYERWVRAPAGDAGGLFVAYTAALDREQAAARSYADVLASGERF